MGCHNDEEEDDGTHSHRNEDDTGEFSSQYAIHRGYDEISLYFKECITNRKQSILLTVDFRQSTKAKILIDFIYKLIVVIMTRTKLSSIDELAEGIGAPLKEDDVSVILFGDSQIEEENRPDSDMIEDDSQIGRALGDFRRVIEAIPIEKDWNEEFRQISTESQNLESDYYLDYFIDGSIRTKYIGELVTPQGSGGPLMVASIGAVAVRVDYDTMRVKPSNAKSKLFVYLVDNISDTAKERIKRKLEQMDPPVNSIFLSQEEAQGNIRGKAGGKARSEMHSIEIEVAKSINSNRRWIAVDGALRKNEFIDLDRAIGIAKSFGSKVIFLGDGKPKTISHLAKMGRGERSKVYRYKILSSKEDSEEKETLEKIGFWYLRIREPPPEMMPLGGIVKVDISLKDDKKYNDITEVADKLSESILKIANPSIFPRPRWPSFVYPVRVAEECLEPLLYTPDEFLRLGISLKRVMYNA